MKKTFKWFCYVFFKNLAFRHLSVMPSPDEADSPAISSYDNQTFLYARRFPTRVYYTWGYYMYKQLSVQAVRFDTPHYSYIKRQLHACASSLNG